METPMYMTVDTDNRSKAISTHIKIMPYVVARDTDLGLSKYGMVLHQGCFNEEPIVRLERNGVVRHVTGLNEFAPEITRMEDGSEKEAAIADIRRTVAFLEESLGSNPLKTDDPHFWDKVKVVHPTNEAFWDTIRLMLTNEPKYLDAKDPNDLILIRAIEAGGFNSVAPSLEAARNAQVPPKWFLDKHEDTAKVKTELKKLRNRAGGLLDELYNNDKERLLHVMKVLAATPLIYRAATPPDVLYEDASNHIDGLALQPNKQKAAQEFIDIVSLDVETLRLRSLVKEASAVRVIMHRPDGSIAHLASGSVLGRSVQDVVLYLKNPLNEDILNTIMTQVKSHWQNK